MVLLPYAFTEHALRVRAPRAPIPPARTRMAISFLHSVWRLLRLKLTLVASTLTNETEGLAANRRKYLVSQ